MNKVEWNNYFCNIENKYNLKMSDNKPIVIFLDGKDITKSMNHSLITENKNSFNDVFEQTVKYFTVELNCMAILGVDEVSFIIEDSKKLKEFVSSKKYKSHEIISIFSQCFYKYFNDRYKNAPIYWHCKCLNIPKGKIKSYIKFRNLSIFDLKLTYFLKRKQVKNAGKIPLAKKEQECSEFREYENIKEFTKGNLYIKGQRIDIDAFLNNRIVELPDIEREEEIIYLDINNF
ncbi:MAG: hypothetical protein IJB90_04040 [Clostridia bacterium]|nr:hypothetical protein [Clostridia bacterium]